VAKSVDVLTKTTPCPAAAHTRVESQTCSPPRRNSPLPRRPTRTSARPTVTCRLIPASLVRSTNYILPTMYQSPTASVDADPPFVLPSRARPRAARDAPSSRSRRVASADDDYRPRLSSGYAAATLPSTPPSIRPSPLRRHAPPPTFAFRLNAFQFVILLHRDRYNHEAVEPARPLSNIPSSIQARCPPRPETALTTPNPALSHSCAHKPPRVRAPPSISMGRTNLSTKSKKFEVEAATLQKPHNFVRKEKKKKISENEILQLRKLTNHSAEQTRKSQQTTFSHYPNFVCINMNEEDYLIYIPPTLWPGLHASILPAGTGSNWGRCHTDDEGPHAPPPHELLAAGPSFPVPVFARRPPSLPAAEGLAVVPPTTHNGRGGHSDSATRPCRTCPTLSRPLDPRPVNRTPAPPSPPAQPDCRTTAIRSFR